MLLPYTVHYEQHSAWNSVTSDFYIGDVPKRFISELRAVMWVLKQDNKYYKKYQVRRCGATVLTISR